MKSHRITALWIIVIVALSACSTATSTPAPTIAGAAPTTIGVAPAETPSAPATAPTNIPPPTVPITATSLPAATATSAAPPPKPTPTQVGATAKPSAPTGKIAYSVVTGEAPKFHTVWVANADGSNPHQIMTHAYWPALSPDGKQIAYLGRPEGQSEGLYLGEVGGKGTLLVIHPGVCCISWSRDGNWIVYVQSNKANQPGGAIFMLKVDGFYKTIVNLGVEGNGPAFSPDGKQIVFSGCVPNTSTCGLMTVATSGGASRIITRDNGGNADWSARGIVYQSNDSANNRQVFFINPDGTGRKQLTSGKSNDGQPVWSRDGEAIFWRSDQNGTAWAIYVMNADGTHQRKLVDNIPPDPNLWGWESLSIAP